MPTLSGLGFDSFKRPLVTVEVRPGAQFHHHFQQLPPNTVPRLVTKFLVDTGADGCYLEEGEIAPWRLPMLMPKLSLSGLGPQVQGYEYPLSLRLYDGTLGTGWYHPTWPVATVPTGRFGKEFKGLIGMDLLSKGGLHFDGAAGVFEIFWP